MSNTDTIMQIGADLLGTCKSLDEVCREYGITEDDLSQDELETLDDHTMCCDSCGWWVESNEIDDNGECQDCTDLANEEPAC